MSLTETKCQEDLFCGPQNMLLVTLAQIGFSSDTVWPHALTDRHSKTSLFGRTPYPRKSPVSLWVLDLFLRKDLFYKPFLHSFKCR